MSKINAFSLLCLSLLVVACADSPEKYRDIKHLEMPPTLAIERNTSAPVKSSRGSASSTSTSNSDTKSTSDLDKLIYITGDDQHPVLQLKTRFDRAWDLINHGLQLAEIEVIEKKQAEGKIRVRYIAGQETKGEGLISSISSLFGSSESEYTLTLDKDSKITGVHIDKLESNEKLQDGAEDIGTNDAAKLADLLQKTIKTNLAK
ncbi:MAG: hypothetical protein RLZ92_1774 [Pseudomonadota bacterium]|jgi:uncharacterized lipoprotein